jgi:photosystem II stability/assembly factor-like uncharacterized protein
MGLALLVGTRKGAFVYRAEDGRARWRVEGPHFLGSIVHHLVLDPRDGRTLLMAAKTGHLGPTVFRSQDAGRTWLEAARPPAFPKAPEAEKEKARAVEHVFWLSPGHASQPGVWWAGTTPHGLFRSEDAGATWEPVEGLNRVAARLAAGGVSEGPPDGATTHSIIVDPRDADRMILGLSTGGCFETRDGATTWRPLNKGCAADFLPDASAEEGQDPHAIGLCAARPDRLYQQNHCGIYRLDRGPGEAWVRIGDNMPREVGDIGFPIVLHPRDPDTVWVFPMDGTEVWPRTSPGGRPAVYRTRDAGARWERQDAGLPREHAYFTVKRQAFAADDEDPVGLTFGTTSGELWQSLDEGASWRQVAAHLPHVYCVGAARFAS